MSWDTSTASNGSHVLFARARDAAGNTANSSPLNVTVTNTQALPAVAINFPANGTQVSSIVTVTADVTSTTAIAGVQFYVDGAATGSEDTTTPYAFIWDTRGATNGAHTLTASARDINGNVGFSAPVTVNVANASSFQNEVLATGFNLPTAIKFLPDGRMLVAELAGTIKVLPPPYTQADPTPFLQLTTSARRGVQQGIYDIALDPNFATNHYYLRLVHRRHAEP